MCIRKWGVGIVSVTGECSAAFQTDAGSGTLLAQVHLVLKHTPAEEHGSPFQNASQRACLRRGRISAQRRWWEFFCLGWCLDVPVLPQTPLFFLFSAPHPFLLSSSVFFSPESFRRALTPLPPFTLFGASLPSHLGAGICFTAQFTLGRM